jgi:hypothetical protein
MPGFGGDDEGWKGVGGARAHSILKHVTLHILQLDAVTFQTLAWPLNSSQDKRASFGFFSRVPTPDSAQNPYWPLLGTSFSITSLAYRLFRPSPGRVRAKFVDCDYREAWFC